MENTNVDESFQISDSEALNIVYEMIKKEGLILGGSSGINIIGAIKLGKLLGKIKILLQFYVIMEQSMKAKFLIKNFLQKKNYLYRHGYKKNN